MKIFYIRATYDPDAAVYVGTCDEVPGFVAESDTLHALREKARVIIPDLLSGTSAAIDGPISIMVGVSNAA